MIETTENDEINLINRLSSSPRHRRLGEHLLEFSIAESAGGYLSVSFI
jgi:hypothetical protein